MPEPQFSSLEDIDGYYNGLVAREDDPVQKAELRVQAAQEKVRFRESEANGRMVDAWRRLAIVEFPNAGKFPELVRGGTEEELRASAKEVHERVSGMMKGAQGGDDGFRGLQDRARDLYGPSGGSGGGNAFAQNLGGSGTPPNMAEERWRQDFAQRFNNAQRDQYGQRLDMSPQEIDRYVRGRFTDHVSERVRFWGNLTRSS